MHFTNRKYRFAHDVQLVFQLYLHLSWCLIFSLLELELRYLFILSLISSLYLIFLVVFFVRYQNWKIYVTYAAILVEYLSTSTVTCVLI